MEPSSTLDLISKDKIHHFFAFIPLLTFIILGLKFWIITIYTIFFALWEMYMLSLQSFINQSTKIVINPPKPTKKLTNKQSWQFLKGQLYFIYNLPIFLITIMVIIGSFVLSFILSFYNIKQDYMNFIFLGHIFLGVFMFWLFKTLFYYKKLIHLKKKNDRQKII